MKKFDVYAIGNALVDSEYQVSDTQLQQAGVEKRHMTLIDAPRRSELLQHMHDVPSHRTGGGSAGNTIVAVAQFGGKAFYSCRVAEDELGAFYTQDLAHAMHQNDFFKALVGGRVAHDAQVGCNAGTGAE